jgi:hypothetical protein
MTGTITLLVVKGDEKTGAYRYDAWPQHAMDGLSEGRPSNAAEQQRFEL